MKTVDLPFSRVATHQSGRIPSIMLNENIYEWFEAQKSDVMHSATFKVEWLLGKTFDTWLVRFKIHNNKTALLFKLTFGGA